MDCIHELNFRIECWSSEIKRTENKIDVEQEKLDKLKLHNEKLSFLISRVELTIQEMEFDLKHKSVKK